MFNFFKFKDKDEFIISLYEAKDKIKDQLSKEILENFSFMVRNEVYDEVIQRMDILRKEFSYPERLIQDQLEIIHKLQNKIEKLETQIETILSMVMVEK